MREEDILVITQKSDFRVREARESDLVEISHLLRRSNYYSSNLFPNYDMLHTDLLWSRRSFQAVRDSCPIPETQIFMFILHDQNHRIAGISLVKRISERLCYDVHIEDGSSHGVLDARDEPDDTFELGGFFLAPEVRGVGMAKLLSYSRIIFLEMAAVPVSRLLTEFLLLADGKEEEGKDPYFWRTVASSAFGGISYRSVEEIWKARGMARMFIRQFPAEIAFETCYGDVETAPHVASDAARHLLVRVGFRYEKKVEADGSVWYWATWNNVHKALRRARMSHRSVKRSVCPEGANLREAIAAWSATDGFHACYVPLEQGVGGEPVNLLRERYNIPGYAELFAF